VSYEKENTKMRTSFDEPEVRLLLMTDKPLFVDFAKRWQPLTAECEAWLAAHDRFPQLKLLTQEEADTLIRIAMRGVAHRELTSPQALLIDVLRNFGRRHYAWYMEQTRAVTAA
jgi:hypothetical protein